MFYWNKTLAISLCSDLKQLFPGNALYDSCKISAKSAQRFWRGSFKFFSQYMAILNFTMDHDLILLVKLSHKCSM